MICGMGIDITDIERIRTMVSQYDDGFLGRVYTEKERSEAALRQNTAPYYAGRWAVKEAVSKALGCGIGEKCAWKDIETLNCESGRPCTTLTGNAAKTMQAIGGKTLHITLSHESGNAIAMAIIE